MSIENELCYACLGCYSVNPFKFDSMPMGSATSQSGWSGFHLTTFTEQYVYSENSTNATNLKYLDKEL